MSKAFSLLVYLVVGFVGGGIAVVSAPYWQKHAPTMSPTNGNDAPQTIVQQNIAEEDSVVTGTVEQASPGVVSVVISKNVSRMRGNANPFGFPFFGFPFGDGSQGDSSGVGSGTEKQTVGEGSGFLVSSDGLIVTNRHVVEDMGADYTVMTNDGNEHPATVLARDPNNDIALIKIDAHDLHALDLGSSDDLKVGQTVIAIGNSLGEFSNTVSKGIVSGLKRNLVAGSELGDSEKLRDIIQTDAAINPGNSGGPLLNISGQVVGVNVAMAQGAQNIGFALPIDQVKRIIDQVKTTGKISTPFLGIRYVMIDQSIQKANNLPMDRGALVTRGEKMTDFAVVPGSPADKADIVENDIILEIDGQAVDKDHQISDRVAEHKAGDTVTLKVWHKGDTKEVKVTLGERS